MQNLTKKINSDFSITEKFRDYIGHPEWQQGFYDVKNNLLPTLPNGQVNFPECPGYSTLWYFLSSAFEDVGVKIYEKTANIISNIRDIDNCSFRALRSMTEEMGVTDYQIFDLNYPVELENILNVYSIHYSNVLLNSNVLTDSSLASIITELSSSLTYTPMSGYVLSGFDDPDLIESLSASQIKISSNDFYSLLESEISACILTNLMTDGIIGDIRTSIDNGQLSPKSVLAAHADTDYIKEQKLKYKVPKSFMVKQEANKIQAGLAYLKDYKPNYQEVLKLELDSRNTLDKFGDLSATFRRFKEEKENLVKQYINLVENLNIYAAEISGPDEYQELIGAPVYFFDVDEFNVPVSGEMITTAVHVLRNVCLKTAYQREYLKRTGQKYSLIGTDRIIQVLIGEYIARRMTTPEYWGYYPFDELSSVSPEISSIKRSSILSGELLGDIKIIEYWDNTEYMNLSTVVDDPTVNQFVNDRFWEGIPLNNSIAVSEHTSAEISGFYASLGLDDMSEAQILDFVNYVYDMGAVSATQYPSFERIPYYPELTGTLGEYGAYEIIGNTVYVSADIQPIISYQPSSFYGNWVSSPVLSGWGLSKFLSAWQNNPDSDSWIDDEFVIDVDSTPTEAVVENNNLDYVNLNQVEDWIKSTFGVSGWVENFNTTVWQQSPLIANWSLEEFQTEWNNNQDITGHWTNVATLSDGTYGWINRNDVQDWLTLSAPLTQQKWEESYFVRSFVDAPFTTAIVDIEFTKSDDWNNSDNPFISGWLLGLPFDEYVSNMSEITSSFTGTSAEINEFLATSGFIPSSDGGLNRPVADYLSASMTGTLSAMFEKYLSEPSGVFPPANIKNVDHPTVAHQPFLWNLIKVISDNIALKNVYEYYPLPISGHIENLSSLIGPLGQTINHWRKDAIDFSAYKTYYENSPNIDLTFQVNEWIDQDGPYHPDALSAFITSPSDFISNFDDWYDYLQVTDLEKAKIILQLETYENDIIELSSKAVYQYGVDKYGNYYTLFKDKNNNEFDTSGQIWVRYKNHPLSFPAYSLSTELEDQIESLIPISVFSQAMNYAFDFGFEDVGSYNLFWSYGAALSATDLTTASLTGNVIISSIDYSTEATKIVAKKLPIDFSFIKELKNEKFVGVYKAGDELIAVSLKNLGTGGSFLEQTGDKFKAKLNFSSFNPIKGQTKTSTVAVTGLNYDEFITDHNQWKLGRADNSITIAFESESLSAYNDLSALFYSTDQEGNSGKVFNTSLNELDKLYENTITTIDFTINDSRPLAHLPTTISYFQKYTDVTYFGINGSDGTGISESILNYSLADDDNPAANFQYFGKYGADANTIGSSAIFQLDGDIFNQLVLTAFTSGNLLGLMYPALDYPTWDETDPMSWNDANQMWMYGDLVTSAHLFTYEGEQLEINAMQLFNQPIYTFTYSGSGCHYFTIDRVGEYNN